MKLNKWENETEEIGGISISHAKKLLKTKGGYAYTLLIDRNGSVQDVVPITLDNNKTSYNNTKTFY